MTFTSHTNHIVSKASEVLNVLKQNLHKCSTSTKPLPYQFGLTHPGVCQLSLGCIPVNKIDRTQCRAAHWSLCNYSCMRDIVLVLLITGEGNQACYPI